MSQDPSFLVLGGSELTRACQRCTDNRDYDLAAHSVLLRWLAKSAMRVMQPGSMPRHAAHCARGYAASGYSNAKTRFQSSFMLITIQPSFLASS